MATNITNIGENSLSNSRKFAKPIITFARFGNYTAAFKTLFEQLGLKVIPPGKTTPQTIAEGAKIAPEMFCFPMKVTIGNYLPALRKGANTIFMVQNVGGSCRQRYYGTVQEKLLKEYGWKINFLDFRATPKDIYLKIKEVTGASFWQILRAARFFFKKISLIEKIEKLSQYYRPREIEKGETDRILNESILEIENLREEKEFPELKKKILKRFSQIEIEKNKDLPKVGLIGEIYTVCDPDVNFGVEKKLGQEGIEVHREMSILYHLKKLIFPWKDWIIQRKINPYLKSTVGGHGRDAIYEMLNYIKEDFDGVVHLLPFSCFPKDTNITVEGFLQKPIQEVKVGEKVLTHKGRFKKVIQTFCRNYKGKLLKIDCGGKLLTISVTPEHPLLLAKTFIKNHKKRIQSFEFIPAHQAEKGDFLAVPIPKIIKNKKFLNWNKKYARKPKWEDGKFIREVSNIVKNNFRAKISQYFYPQKRPNNITLYMGNRNLADIVYHLCNSHCDQKVLNRDLVLLKPQLQKELLKGFFRRDGNFRDEYGETTYRGVTTSWNLASQLFWFLIRNRIKASFLEQHIKNKKLSYVLKISNAEGIKRLGDELIKVTNRINNVRFKELENYFLVPIRKIKIINFKGKVYNLEVEDDHSYVANFLAVHNCMPEITVRPILERLHQESGIPFLSLSLDEQVAEAGIDTRIEAFVDVVKNYHAKKKN